MWRSTSSRADAVAVLDDLSTGARGNVPKGALFYEADIRSGCAEIFTDFGPEALCHQAAQMDVRRSVKEPDFDADVNVLGTVRLLQSVPGTRRAEGRLRLHGRSRVRRAAAISRPRGSPAVLRLPYGVSKLAGERYLHYYCISSSACPTSHSATPTSTSPGQDPHGEAGSWQSSAAIWPVLRPRR